MIRVQGTGLSGFAFPTCVIQVAYYTGCDEMLSSLTGWIDEPVWLHRERLVDFKFYAVANRIKDIGYLLDDVPYYDDGFLLSTGKAGFGTLAVYRDGGLLMSESLFDNISYLLGYRMGCTYYDDDLNGFVSSGWYELVSLDGVVFRPKVSNCLYACSLYDLMKKSELGSRFLRLGTHCFRRVLEVRR